MLHQEVEITVLAELVQNLKANRARQWLLRTGTPTRLLGCHAPTFGV